MSGRRRDEVEEDVQLGTSRANSPSNRSCYDQETSLFLLGAYSLDEKVRGTGKGEKQIT
jgi:hypothetical protein